MATTAQTPKWHEATTRIHDWRNHVPDDVKQMWDEFTGAQRLALFHWACDLAEQEHWD